MSVCRPVSPCRLLSIHPQLIRVVGRRLLVVQGQSGLLVLRDQVPGRVLGPQGAVELVEADIVPSGELNLLHSDQWNNHLPSGRHSGLEDSLQKVQVPGGELNPAWDLREIAWNRYISNL